MRDSARVKSLYRGSKQKKLYPYLVQLYRKLSCSLCSINQRGKAPIYAEASRASLGQLRHGDKAYAHVAEFGVSGLPLGFKFVFRNAALGGLVDLFLDAPVV